MIVFISVQQPQLESPVDERFGRASWFVKLDTETYQWEALANPGVSQSGGAGVAAAQFVIDNKAGAVISGDFGPNALRALEASAVKMIRFPEGVKTAGDILKLLQQGILKM